MKIPSITEEPSNIWKIRALEIEGRSPALAKLVEWEKSEPKNFTKIHTSLRMAARVFRVSDRKWVAKGRNADVYEAIAYSLEARLMFFYCEIEKAIVCTNHCWKPTDNQSKAFELCARLKLIYEQVYGTQKPTPPKRHR